MKVSYTHEIPMGHRLMKHEGKCRFLHGHNYEVTVTLDGSVNPRSGFVIDFSSLKRAVRQVLGQYDHAFVLEEGDPAVVAIAELSLLQVRPCPPTAENLAMMWKREIADELKEPASRIVIEVRETKDCCATTA